MINNLRNHPFIGANDLDSAMAMLWDFYKKYFVSMYIISLVMAVIQGILSASLDLASLQTTTDPQEMLNIMKEMIVPYSVILAVSLVFGVLLHSWILARPLEGSNAFTEAVKAGARVFIPYFLVLLVLGMAGAFITGLGLVMLILPGFFALLYIITVALFSLPVALTETGNPGEIITRSFKLAHRNFWPNLAWVTVMALLIIIVSVVIGGLTMLPFTGTFIKSVTDPEAASSILEMAKNPVYIAANALLSALITPIFPILAFILYFRNRDDVDAMAAPVSDEPRVRVEDLYPKMPDRDEQK